MIISPSIVSIKASGQAFVDTELAIDHYLGPHGSKTSKLEYDRLLGEWLQNGRSPLQVAECEITVVEVASRYLRFAQQYYQKDGKPAREAENIRIVVRNLCELYGRTLAVAFGPRVVENYQ